MPTKINTPDIRFKGFSAPWEQRELNDIVLNHNAGVYIAKEQYGIGLNIIGVGDLYSSDVVDGTIYRYAPVSDIKYLLETGDIIYGESSLVPEGIAKAMYVNEKGSNTAFAWHTRRVKVNKKIVDSFFVVLEINYNSMTRTFLMQNSTQTALTGMTTSSFLKAPIQVCSKEEQLRISSMFSKVDNLITLHQRKYALNIHILNIAVLLYM